MRFATTRQALDPDAFSDGPFYGMPRYSRDAKQWVIDWLGPEDGICEGVTLPTAAQAAWIAANPDEVSKMREQLIAWLADLDDIPF